MRDQKLTEDRDIRSSYLGWAPWVLLLGEKGEGCVTKLPSVETFLVLVSVLQEPIPDVIYKIQLRRPKIQWLRHSQSCLSS